VTGSINVHTIPSLQAVDVYEDILLRPLEQSHASRVLEILDADESIRERVTVASRMHTQEDVAKEIVLYKNDTGLIRYVLLRDSDPVGMISLWRDDGFWGEKNLDDYGFGYFLDPHERGKGLITKAVQKLMEVVSQNLYVRQFVAFSEDTNTGSVAVLKKLGFQPTSQTLTEPTNGWIERKYIKPVK
jgi:RimJ/RimL family protein N-acetyltransferase